MQILAQRATTKEWLHFDLPLNVSEVGWALSAPGHLKATVDPLVGSVLAEDGLGLLEEWGTLLYVLDGGAVRWGGVVALSRPEGGSWVVEAAGFGSYPHSRVHRGDYVKYGVDPAQVIKDIWAHIQETPNGNLGVQVVGDTTPVRLGDYGYIVRDGQRLNFTVPHKEFQQLFDAGWTGGYIDMRTMPEDLVRWLADYAGFGMIGSYLAWLNTGAEAELSQTERDLLNADWYGGPIAISALSTSLKNHLLASGWSTRDGYPADQLWAPAQNGRVLADGDQTVEPAPYRIKRWTSTYAGRLIDDMVKAAPLEWVERTLWDGDTATPQIVVGYPRVGRKREDLAFELDVNVTNVDYAASLADEHANTVVATGSGRDGGMLRSEVTRSDGRLARDHVSADGDEANQSTLARIASTEARRRTTAGVSVSSLTVREHSHAPISSWQVGDDILLRAHLPYVGEVEQWLRITAWVLHSDGTATLTTERADSYLYGG